jgi:8-oxo-dGTP pyrophosphatase MutT (NUDIX family)
MRDHSSEHYTEATLCFPVRGDKVLLAEKQKKIGAGYLNGFGGKAEPGDADIFATNARETEEEIGIRIRKVHKVGEIIFHNPSDDDELKRMRVHVFIATDWSGEPTETDEMKKIAWHDIANLDFDKFLPADRLFLPQILAGHFVRGLIEYNDDWSVKASHITIND